jgi:hypothetical protein
MSRKLAISLIIVLASVETAAAITVTSGANSGAGTLRQAIADFPASGDTEIVIDNSSVTTITLTSTITYSNSKRLKIRSTSSTEVDVSGTSSAINCTSANGIEFIGLDFDGGGVTLSVPSSAAGTVFVDLDGVDIWNRASGAGLSISNTSSSTLYLTFTNVQFIANAGMGCYVFKSGGDLVSVFDTVNAYLNGWNSVADGVQLCQLGTGGNFVWAQSCSFAGNAEDGLEIEEAGDGDVEAYVFDIVCSEMEEEALEISEAGNGNLTVEIYGGEIYDTIDETTTGGDAVEIRERDSGTFECSILGVAVLDSADTGSQSTEKDGIRLDPGGTGNATVVIDSCVIEYCHDDGIEFESNVSYSGYSDVLIIDSFVSHCDNNGIKAVSGTGGGTLDIDGDSITNYQDDNADDLDLDGTTWTKLNFATTL